MKQALSLKPCSAGSADGSGVPVSCVHRAKNAVLDPRTVLDQLGVHTWGGCDISCGKESVFDRLRAQSSLILLQDYSTTSRSGTVLRSCTALWTELTAAPLPSIDPAGQGYSDSACFIHSSQVLDAPKHA